MEEMWWKSDVEWGEGKNAEASCSSKSANFEVR